MSGTQTEKEPSIEEILESIRQIISEDGEGEPQQAAAVSVQPAPKPRPAPPAAPPPPPALPADGDVIDLTDKVTDDYKSDLDLSVSPEEIPASDLVLTGAQEPVDNGGGLLSSITEETATDAMARLLAGNVAVERELPGRVGKVTLEDMTRDLLRPLLKSWLDQNLTRLIEKMVQKEIEKISRRAMNRE